MKSNRTIVLGIILIVLLIAAGFFWFFIRENNGQTADNNKDRLQPQQAAADFNVETKQLAKTQILRGFPTNLPQEEGGKILQNYESQSSDGRLQSTKKFTSTSTPQAALTKYANFFEDLGWARNSKDSIKSPALFSKGQDILMIVSNKESGENNTVVEITMIQKNAVANK
jgi:hypothetical protein